MQVQMHCQGEVFALPLLLKKINHVAFSFIFTNIKQVCEGYLLKTTIQQRDIELIRFFFKIYGSHI